MVLIAPLIGAAVFLTGLTAAAPTNSYDSSSNSNSYGSSSDNSNYGSSNSNSNYGSSNSNYGSSNDNSNYGSSDSNSYGGNSNNYDSSSSSSNNYDSTSSSYNNNYDSSSSSSDSSTMNMDSTSTTTAYNSYQTSNYGSGSSYWGGSGYEDCVNQCIAQFGGSTGGGYYQATATGGSYGSSGSGATHTVIVAPHTGVFRMVPFMTNASVGDTIEFHWGADNHTVTKSSELLPCNKSQEAPVFASGEQNNGFVFRQIVNDTNPTFYYCGTATHCEKGMFGIINPSMAAGSSSSFGGMMGSMAANDSDLSAYAAYSSNITTNNAAASNWGSGLNMSAIPDWAHSLVATNILFTRGVIGMNADILQADNSIDLKSAAANPLMLPMDISQPLNDATAANAANAPSGSDAASPAGAAETAASSPSPTANKPNGASAVASPRLLVAAAVVVATIFAL